MTTKEQLKLLVDTLDDEQASVLIAMIYSFRDSVPPTDEEIQAIKEYQSGKMGFVTFDDALKELGIEL